jgi:hypothetical protein
VRIDRGLVADGQPASKATVHPRPVSCCWQNVGRESLGLGLGRWVGRGGEGRGGEGSEEAATMAQLHVTPHRAARSLGEMWKGVCFLLPALSTRFV